MSEHLLQNIPPQHQEKAEQIRAYLVHVRGGAPFLSGADCRLLIAWLDAEISVLAITTSIDKVAEKRRAKRVRSRLTLNNCKGTLKKILSKKTSTPKSLQQVVHVGLEGLSQQILQLDMPKNIQSLQQQLAQSLSSLSKEDLCMHDQAEKGIDLCREFHEKVWEQSFDQHEDLHERAEQELESLRTLLGPQHWREMLEEVMRDKLRSQYPIISAQSIWNAVQL